MLAARFANEDLTDALRVARDDALRKRFEAEAANASKTIFLANMSHELRTPLNAILGFSDIIAEQSFGPAMDRYSEYARDIHNSGAHLLSLINDLLDVAKIEAGKMEIDPQPLDPAPLLESVHRLMGSRAAAKGQVLDFDLGENMRQIIADPRAIKQIVLNLVSNAVKFTPDGGRIQVRCGLRRQRRLHDHRRRQRPGHREGKARQGVQAVQPGRQPLRQQRRRHRSRAGAGPGPGPAPWRQRHRSRARSASEPRSRFTFR